MTTQKIFFSILFLFSFSSIFSQQNIVITGTIKADKVIISDAIVELKNKTISKFAVSDNKGFYKFSTTSINKNDTLTLTLKYLGYKLFLHKFINLSQNNTYNINLIDESAELLNEVFVTADANIINTAKKSIYKINQKNFIVNAKAIEVLATIPSVFVDSEGVVIVDGTLPAIIFIDGIQSMKDELKMIEAKEIEKVELINNPSAKFGTDFTGAVINIISKKNTNEFFNGNFEGSRGLKFNSWYLNPRISYKRGRFIFKSNYSQLGGDSRVDYSVNRLENNENYKMQSINNSERMQRNFQSRLNIKLSDKSDFNLSGSLWGYKFEGTTFGNQSLNNTNLESFTKNGVESNEEWNISSVYSYKIKENKSFYFKSKYNSENNTNRFDYLIGNSNVIYSEIISKCKEFSNDIDYEVEDFNLFKMKTSFYINLKYINRNYTFSNTDFYVNQNIVNTSFEVDTEWSNKFSTEFVSTFEYTKNFNLLLLDKTYQFILPVINALYHFENKIDCKLSYSKKVLRPGANSLNDALLIINPAIAKQGNSNLDPQIRDYYSLTFSKSIKANNYSIKFYDESINNAITDVYRTQHNLLIQTLENTAKYNSIGLSLGLRTMIFKKIMVNLNSGLDYNTFVDNSALAKIKNNSGYTFRGNLFLSSNLFKDKVLVSLSCNQNGPNYSLLSKRITNPYLDFTIKTNLIKDKLSISLNGQNFYGNYSEISDISNGANFYQKIDILNNGRNLLLRFTYNFGKKFNDTIIVNDINNDDIKK